MRRAPIPALLALGLACAVTACGGGGSETVSTTTQKTVSTQAATPLEASDSTTPASSAAPTTTATSYRILSENELADALIGIDDLPAGYSEEPDGGSESTKTFCDYEAPFEPMTHVRRDFTKGGGLSAEILSVGLREYANADQARASFDAMAHALDSCETDQYQGQTLTYALMSAPQVGDASLGVKISGGGAEVPQFFILAGPTLINTGGGGLMNADNDEILDVLSSQTSKYQAAASR